MGSGGVHVSRPSYIFSWATRSRYLLPVALGVSSTSIFNSGLDRVTRGSLSAFTFRYLLFIVSYCNLELHLLELWFSHSRCSFSTCSSSDFNWSRVPPPPQLKTQVPTQDPSPNSRPKSQLKTQVPIQDPSPNLRPKSQLNTKVPTQDPSLNSRPKSQLKTTLVKTQAMLRYFFWFRCTVISVSSKTTCKTAYSSRWLNLPLFGSQIVIETSFTSLSIRNSLIRVKDSTKCSGSTTFFINDLRHQTTPVFAWHLR